MNGNVVIFRYLSDSLPLFHYPLYIAAIQIKLRIYGIYSKVFQKSTDDVPRAPSLGDEVVVIPTGGDGEDDVRVRVPSQRELVGKFQVSIITKILYFTDFYGTWVLLTYYVHMYSRSDKLTYFVLLKSY